LFSGNGAREQINEQSWGGRVDTELNERDNIVRAMAADRIGFAKLTRMAFDGIDLRPLRDALILKVSGGTAGAGDGMDLSLIVQLLGDKQTGMAIQAEVLGFHQLFRSPCALEKPKLRVLALGLVMLYVFEFMPVGRRLLFVGRGRGVARLRV